MTFKQKRVFTDLLKLMCSENNFTLSTSPDATLIIPTVDKNTDLYIDINSLQNVLKMKTLRHLT